MNEKFLRLFPARGLALNSTEDRQVGRKNEHYSEHVVIVAQITQSTNLDEGVMEALILHAQSPPQTPVELTTPKAAEFSPPL
ncbi:hypothetical protein E5288_WYG006617 [Bos mutus]|uniref:Uncharacterized protein n=1 Tax=Bos mutus TaxID=72004 RepID=A0A6B0RA48_9CETA|nr:hypothetical protein [Bos mutus]